MDYLSEDCEDIGIPDDELISSLTYSGIVAQVEKIDKPCGKICPRDKGEAKVYIAQGSEKNPVSICLGKEDLTMKDLEGMVGEQATVKREDWLKNGRPYVCCLLTMLSGKFEGRTFEYEVTMENWLI